MKKRTRKQAGKMSKAKGRNFENQVAKIIRESLGFPDKKHYHNSRGSGAHFTSKGDLTTSSKFRKVWPFCVECKKQEATWTYKNIFTVTYGEFMKTNIHQWWLQAVDETPKGLNPMLIFSKNRENIYVVVCLKDEIISNMKFIRPRLIIGNKWYI